MLADAGAAGHHREVDQMQVPEAAQFGFALNGDIEGRPQLDGPGHPGRRRRLVCGIDGVCDILRALDLRAQEVKERVGLAVDAAGQLDLLDHLICRMV